MFKPGDIVKLKSGSPKMTVDSVYGNTITCVWFDNTVCKKQDINADALEPYVKPKSLTPEDMEKALNLLV